MTEGRRPPAADATGDADASGTPWASAPTEISQLGFDPDDGSGAELRQGVLVADRYRVLSYLGRGGMGAVYAVHDDQLDEVVALKLLHPRLAGDPRYRQRLRGEVRLARRVSHPNVCRVHDLGQAGSQLFVTMERVPGVSLRQLLRESRAGAQPLSLAGAVDLVVQICSALAAAHRAGVLHRDIKPDNVIVDAGRAVLTDFGVASLATDLGPRVIAGTPAYIAPEVLRGESYDQRVDVYGAAVVAYELLSGAVPFPTASLDDAMRRAAAHPSPPPLPAGLATAAVRAGLDRVLAHGLAYDPLHRLASTDRLAVALAHAARGSAAELTGRGGDVEATPTPTTATARRPEIRAATVLVFRCNRLGAGPDQASIDPHSATTEETLIVPLVVPGDDLERVVVDLGGTPVHIGALEITALFGAPVSLGDDAERAPRRRTP